MTMVKGTVIWATSRVQFVQPRAKYLGFWKGGLVNLIGDNYLYSCLNCGVSVCQWQLPTIEKVLAARIPFEEATGPKPRCPHCFGILESCKEGDKVLLHYRFKHPTADQYGKIVEPGWGAWFAERKDW